MGWLAKRMDGPLTAQAVIASCLGEGITPQIVDATCRGGVIYVAIRSQEGQDVSGLVILTRKRDGLLYTKLIPEDMGPAEDACPAAILDVLTAPSNDNARNWRKRCYARLGKVQTQT